MSRIIGIVLGLAMVFLICSPGQANAPALESAKSNPVQGLISVTGGYAPFAMLSGRDKSLRVSDLVSAMRGETVTSGAQANSEAPGKVNNWAEMLSGFGLFILIAMRRMARL